MISQAQLRAKFHYDPDTGEFTRLTGWGKYKAGSVAGHVTSRGYRLIEISGTAYGAHRLAFLYTEGSMPRDEVDHINRNKDDNRLRNLRKVSRAMNARNRGQYKNNTSGHVGVLRRGNRYRARIFTDGAWVDLGTHDTFDRAVAVYNAAKPSVHYVKCQP